MRLIDRDAHLIKKSLNEYHDIKKELNVALDITEGERQLMVMAGIDKDYASYVSELKEQVRTKEVFFTNLLEGYIDIILSK